PAALHRRVVSRRQPPECDLVLAAAGVQRAGPVGLGRNARAARPALFAERGRGRVAGGGRLRTGVRSPPPLRIGGPVAPPAGCGANGKSRLSSSHAHATGYFTSMNRQTGTCGGSWAA